MPAPARSAIRRAAILAAVASACVASLPARAIDGGAAASRRDALAQATVGIGTVTRPDDVYRLTRCSGVLISADLVLTAAHCLNGDPLGAIIVFYRGSEAVRPVYTARVVARFSPDPGDLSASAAGITLADLSLDLAVLRLSAPVRDRVPVPLAASPQRVPSALRMAGVGLSGRGVGRLRTARLVPLAASSTGLTIARVDGARVCLGDSGGPVVAQDRRGLFVWGVASAVITDRATCGSLVVVAPAAQVFGARGGPSIASAGP
ncbi:trypsin-like serine protease [Methylobacterium durans]|uniref:Peptidase S1 n=1 Tax=Methylobacterium durans TaxID=2202825 RepID=A0A2U8W2V1_9HYPH|nr:trypsin-like serine protease [Methylobacterium durans]AWN40423.1 peptidase S1 [Methylobacterium durans]